MEGDPRVIVGWVLDNGGDTPRKASLIKYTISWTELGELTDQVPDDERPPDQVDGQDLETIPLRVHTTAQPSVVFGAVVGNALWYWAAHERPAMAECAAPGGGGSGGLRRRGVKDAPSETTGGQQISGPTAGGITR